MRISDWSSDVCSSDLIGDPAAVAQILSKNFDRDAAEVDACAQVDHLIGRNRPPAEAVQRAESRVEIRPLFRQRTERGADKSLGFGAEVPAIIDIGVPVELRHERQAIPDRKSTRLNS